MGRTLYVNVGWHVFPESVKGLRILSKQAGTSHEPGSQSIQVVNIRHNAAPGSGFSFLWWLWLMRLLNVNDLGVFGIHYRQSGAQTWIMGVWDNVWTNLEFSDKSKSWKVTGIVKWHVKRIINRNRPWLSCSEDVQKHQSYDDITAGYK